MDGIHLLGEWFDCNADSALFSDAEALRTLCLELTRASGLTAVGERFHQFDPQGVTGAVILAESHLAVHTWPEIGSVTIDVYVCNFTTDNTAKARRLFEVLERSLKPARTRYQEIQRGGAHG